MPESFDGMLAELADAAASATPLPDVAAVRRRARERTVHRRVAASALAVAVLVACGGTVAAVRAELPGATSVGPLGTPPGGAAGTTSAAGTAQPSPSAAATPSATAADGGAAAAEAAKEPFAKVAGLWQLADGGSELVVFPDGVIGMGKTGDWQLCEGRIVSTGDGVDFKVAALACGDEGTTDLALQLGPAASELTLKVGSGPDVTLMYRRTSQPLGVPDEALSGADIKTLMGRWSSGASDGRALTVLSAGFVAFTAHDQYGNLTTSFAGKITDYYGDVVRVETACPKPIPGLAYCGVMELEYDKTAATMIVVGGDGAEAFTRTGAGATTGAEGTTFQSATPPAARTTAETAVSLTGSGASLARSAAAAKQAAADSAAAKASAEKAAASGTVAASPQP